MPKNVLSSVSPHLVPPVTRKPAGTSVAEAGASLSFPFGPPLLPPFAGDDDE
ncbi:hypothetical protein [Kineosporia sp. NBRC 101731]|uniref:hypothetical protein n=1 Tax=Kineosporia sp. NBRC 101731 TaxID=3032199 RepID=UPI0024A23C79|nr:hypothetical protein [Kineosporia sp. NBRC 101731]GLY30748.1 hypothetical protein Kisp02_41130 [Kineosporia sp. NBRC 101731]